MATLHCSFMRTFMDIDLTIFFRDTSLRGEYLTSV
nr:MAG TPA_asm: hypothetical protein [Caudoviricetes sp.]